MPEPRQSRRSPEASHTSQGPAPRGGRRASRRRILRHSLRSEARRRGNFLDRADPGQSSASSLWESTAPIRSRTASSPTTRRRAARKPACGPGSEKPTEAALVAESRRLSACHERRPQDRRERHPADTHDDRKQRANRTKRRGEPRDRSASKSERDSERKNRERASATFGREIIGDQSVGGRHSSGFSNADTQSKNEQRPKAGRAPQSAVNPLHTQAIPQQRRSGWSDPQDRQAEPKTA